jgi:hypothetical protein
MPRKRNRTTDLATLYARFVDGQSEEWRARCAVVCRERSRKLSRLHKQDVRSVADLLSQLPRLPPSLKYFGVELTWLLKIRRAVPVLIDIMQDQKSNRGLRISCALALYYLEPGKEVTQLFVRIGNRELGSSHPDHDWLEAIIHGLGAPDDPQAVKVLVAIFERVDLRGSLRGDAADKLGCVGLVKDRRTALFRRCRDAALRGLNEPSIDVQFWSMYLIGSLCSDYRPRRRSSLTGFESALPRLRQIAATDHRLAPGYWWPMSGEAEDIIGCIETGSWPQPDAADRWPVTTRRAK